MTELVVFKPLAIPGDAFNAEGSVDISLAGEQWGKSWVFTPFTCGDPTGRDRRIGEVVVREAATLAEAKAIAVAWLLKSCEGLRVDTSDKSVTDDSETAYLILRGHVVGTSFPLGTTKFHWQL